VLSVEQISPRLEDSSSLLTGGSRTATPHQKTLRATLEWSWELLSEAERKLLERMAVFAGGWTLEAAEAAGAGSGIEEGEVLELPSGLVALPWCFVAAAVVVTHVEIFPTRVRYSGASIGLNVGIMAFSRTAPLVGTFLVAQTDSNIASVVYLVAVAVVVSFAAFALPETYRLSLLKEGEGRTAPDPASERSS